MRRVQGVPDSGELKRINQTLQKVRNILNIKKNKDKNKAATKNRLIADDRRGSFRGLEIISKVTVP